jgi:glycosyltransferase involved in cell wall biosynthesis
METRGLARTLAPFDGSNGSSPLRDRVEAELVSVVIPAYRCAQYIGQAVESVLAQTFPAYEIIVVNDGCPDTPLLEAALAPYRDRVRYIRQPTCGPAGARNTGILRARGKYIAFLDGDDYWCTDHLAKQIAMLRQDPALDLVYSDTILLKDERPVARAFDLQPQSTQVTFESLLAEHSAISTSSTVACRDAIMAAGMFDESFLRCEDFDMWLRMSFAGSRMAFQSEARVHHRISDVGLSADRWAMKKDRIRVYQKIDATLPVSEPQRRIVREMVAMTEAQCDVERMKHALEAGDYNQAVEAADRAAAFQNNWKVKISRFCLRIAPRLFRRLHLARSFVLRRGKYGKSLAGGVNHAPSGQDWMREKRIPMPKVAAPSQVSPRGRN